MVINETDFINLTDQNLKSEHLSCIIRTKKTHPGVEEKRKWLSERLKEGHVFRKLNVQEAVFIEYAPLEYAWVPIEGENFLYIYCLWVNAGFKGKGYGKALMEYCIKEARESGRSGVCLLGSDKQKAWLTDMDFARKFGFRTVDSTLSGYQLLALSFDGTKPHFAPSAKQEKNSEKGVCIYYDMQCPYIMKSLETVKKVCDEHKEVCNLIKVDTLEMAKNLPCVFNNWAVLYNGKFVTINLSDAAYIKKLIKS